MEEIKIEKTNNFVDFITGEHDAYDKEKMNHKIYFATDTQEIIVNGISFGNTESINKRLKALEDKVFR